MAGATVVITGAHGFLGRHAARIFAGRGYSVVGIGHGNWSRADWESWGLSDWHQADVTLEFLRRFAGAPYAILHCAGSGSVGFSVAQPFEDFQRTVATTAHVLEYVRLDSPATRVVYPSSASVYGRAETFPIREDCRLAPIAPYGAHKRMAEELLAFHARWFQAAVSVVRFFSVYGCGLQKQLLWDACRKLTAGDRVFMGTGDEIRDWLHVDDAAELLLLAVERASPECPTANGGTGEGVRVRELLNHVAQSLCPSRPSVEFSGVASAWDPECYIADPTRAISWGWRPQRQWRKSVAEYVAWWLGTNASRSDSTSSSK